MSENSLVTGRVFSKLFFSFVVVLFLGMVVLDFSLRQVLEQSLRTQTDESLASEARLVAAHISVAASPDALQKIAQQDATAADAEVAVFDAQGQQVANSKDVAGLKAVPPEIAAILYQHKTVGRARREGTVYVAVPAGPLVVRLAAYSPSDVPAPVYVLRRGIVLASLFSLVVATLLAAVLAQRAAKRLARIVVFAKRIASGDLTARVEEGNLDEISAVAHALDVTASRLEQSFHALESSRSELTALLDSMQEAVIAINPQGQVSWCNAVMQRIALSPVQEGRALVHSIRDPEVLSSVALALTQRQASRRRAISVAPGKIFEVNAAPMPGGGAVAVLHDISEKERSETTRRDFVANVSHELRTPLTCITGYVETLLDDRSLSSQTREFLLIILKNASRMNRLTEDLLALASVESGDYKLRLQKIKASTLVEEAVGSLAGLVIDSELNLEVGEATDEPVMADLDALSQVFGNLVENAMKYGKAGGRVRVGARQQEAMVEFYVQDFGPGIAYEHLPRIFERFYRVDKARSRESGGTGLGLAIAKHIVHAHGGDIRCESELGFGATFLFRLPRVVAPPPPAVEAAPAASTQTVEK
ncbi:MAG: ATP-binding protein [Acidobacteriaceae bacterium]|jgi:two-component system phosphate regulon sensor histidine kinase PhoR